MKRINSFDKRIFILICLVVISFSLVCQEKTGSDSNNKDKSGKPEYTDDEYKYWKNTVQYGIDADIKNVVSVLKKRKVFDFNKSLFEIFIETDNILLRMEILGLWEENRDRIAFDFVLKEIEKDPENIFYFKNLLHYTGKMNDEKGSEVLFEHLYHSNKQIAESSALALKYVSFSGIADKIIKVLENKEKPLAKDAGRQLILALGEIGDPKAEEILLKILQDSNDDYEVMFAAVSLSQLNSKKGIEPIYKIMLNHTNPRVRERGAAVLANYTDSEVIPLLMKLLRNDNAKIRYAACEGLGKNKATEAIDILAYKFKFDPDKNVSEQSVLALIRIAGKAFNKINDIYLDKKTPDSIKLKILRFILMENSSKGLEMLADTYSSLKDDFREKLSKYISTVSNENLKPLTNLMLLDKNPTVRLHGIYTAFRNKDKTQLTSLQKIAEDDPVPNLRTAAEKMMVKIKE